MTPSHRPWPIHCDKPVARFFVDAVLAAGSVITLPERAARHAQVLRLQPGQIVEVFDATATAYDAEILRMGRRLVEVTVGAPRLELPTQRPPHEIAVGMPANERMDWLVEKATELGAAVVHPLLTERSVLRLSGERAERRREHWQGVAIAAAEQCGRRTVPTVMSVRTLTDWLPNIQSLALAKWLLSLDGDAEPLPANVSLPVLSLSGPEGGLTPIEERAALAAGFLPVTLGPLTLRSETAPVALLAALHVVRA